MKILVFCPNGHVFESGMLSGMRNVRGLSLRGNRESCPVCGALAEIMDGEIDVVEGAVRVLAAPQTTLDRLRRLQALVGNLRDESASAEKIVETLQKESPELARTLPQDRSQWRVWLAILIAIIGIWIQHYDATHQSRPASEHDIEQIIQTILEHQQQELPKQTEPPTPPPTMPPSPPAAPESPAPRQTPP